MKKSKFDRILFRIEKIRSFLLVLDKHFVFKENFSSDIRYVVDHFRRLFVTRGLEFTLNRFKQSRLCFTKALCNDPLLIPGLANNPKGIPLWLSRRVTPDMSNLEVRSWMTLLTISRAFMLAPKLNIDSIIEPSETIFTWEDRISITDILYKELKIRKLHLKWREPHMSTKSGPNGQALVTSLRDLTLLPPRLKEDLILLGGKELKSYWDILTSEILPGLSLVDFNQKSFLEKNTKKSIRRLTYFSDKEGKSRVIAIMDYWTQSVLKPLHEHINSILKGISTDCTFNQNHFLTCLNAGPYSSLDLKAATDRMPVVVQQYVLSHIIGDHRSEAWKRVLTDWEFDSDAGQVLYKVGQPMGAYSSWPVMALTHHVLVRLAARWVGLYNFNNYALLGDDIVIGDDRVAESYKKLLHKFDMPISQQKSHTSPDVYEFAKRWVRKGEEVTGFSLSGLLEVVKNYPLFSNFIETQLLHGLRLKSDSDPGLLLEDLMKAQKKYQQAGRTAKLLRIFTLIKDIIFKDEADKLESLLLYLALPFDIDITTFKKVVRICLKNQCASDVSESNSIRSQFMFKLMDLTSEDLGYGAQESDLLYNYLLENHPVCRIFYQTLRESLKDYDRIQASSFEEVVDLYRSRTLSGSKFNLEIFSMRNCHSQAFNQSRLVKDLWRALKKLLTDSEDDVSFWTLVRRKVLGKDKD